MKNFDVIHVLLFLLLMLVYQIVDAQDYVLTTRGDSLTGEVRPLLFGPEKKVQIVGPDKKKNTLSLFEVRAFSSDGQIYHPVRGETGYMFMKLIQQGYLSLYAYQPENQHRFDGLFLQKLDGDHMVVPNLGFKKYLGQFLEDCPAVAQRIKDGELHKKNLTELVNAYNACIDSRTVDHEEEIANRQEQTIQISAWDSLEEKVIAADFSEKANALEMISEIRKKIQQQEKIPNFLLEGLKNSLKGTGLTATLEEAIEETTRQ
ncbi:MAG: hypothetical protein WEB30_10025 [Cyclobacteriaceae bacterium]